MKKTKQNANVSIEYDEIKNELFARDLRDTNNDPALFTTSKRGVKKFVETIIEKWNEGFTHHDLMIQLQDAGIKYHYWCMMD